MLTEKVKKERLIPLSFDPMFKKVFGDENDKEPLKYLLKVILEMEVKELIILNSEIMGESVHSKRTTVDLIVTLKDGMKVGIEMNRTVSKDIIDRNLVYMFRIMSNSLGHGESYEKLDRHIQINFDMGGEHNLPIERYKLISTSNIRNVLTEKLEIIRIDVPHFTNKCYNEDKLSEQEKFIGLIGMTDRNKMRKIVEENAIMEEIVDKIEDFSEEVKMAAMYDYDFHLKEVARIAARQELEEDFNQLKEQKNQVEEEINKIEEQKTQIEEQKTQIEEQKTRIEAEKNQIEEEKNQIQTAKNKIAEDRSKITEERNIIEQERAKIKEEVSEKIIKGKLDVVKRMLEKRCDVNFISEVTGFTIDEIETLESY